MVVNPLDRFLSRKEKEDKAKKEIKRRRNISKRTRGRKRQRKKETSSIEWLVPVCASFSVSQKPKRHFCLNVQRRIVVRPCALYPYILVALSL